MIVQDLRDILDRLDSHQKVRVVMTGLHMIDGENGEHPCGPSPDCRFADSEPPEVKPDETGIVELRFNAE